MLQTVMRKSWLFTYDDVMFELEEEEDDDDE